MLQRALDGAARSTASSPIATPRARSSAHGRDAGARGQEPAVRHPRRGAAAGAAASSDEDRALTQLICDETDRIRALVDRMEVFADERPLEREPVNIHEVLDHVRAAGRDRLRRGMPLHRGLRSVAAAGARQPRPADPGVPQPGEERRRGDPRDAGRRIVLSHRLPAGRAPAPAAAPSARVSCRWWSRCRTTAPAFPSDLAPHLFDPFVTTKANGTGWAWRWSPRSSATMAASSSSTASRGAPCSASCCRMQDSAARDARQNERMSHGQRTILVADDDRAIRTVLTQALARVGYDVARHRQRRDVVALGGGGRGRPGHHRRGDARRERPRPAAAHPEAAARSAASSS